MLRSLTYSNDFPSTGRTLAGNIQFQKGLGAITGPNESGKSFIIEMVRFSLFGSAALRGRADDYRKLKAELVFAVKGQAYRVVRSGPTAMLFRGAGEIAVGIRPVNAKIIQILGFGLEVFDVASVCNQGDIEKLGSMRPAERKRMVDSVIGLDVIEQLGRWASDEALGLTREAEAIERTLVEPAKPTEPFEYRPSSELVVEVAQLHAVQRELDGLEGWLSHKLSEPREPQCDIASTAAELRELMLEQMRKEAEEFGIKSRLAGLPSPSPYSDDDLRAMEAQHAALALWQERLRFERLHPGSPYSPHALSQSSADWLCLERHDELGSVEHRLSHADHHDCPKCQHRWPADPMSVARLTGRRTELLALIDSKPRPSQPELSPNEIKQHLMSLADRETHAGDWQRLKDVLEVAPPPMSLADVARCKVANAQAAERQEIEAKLTTFVPPDHDWKALFAERSAYEGDLARYHVDVQRYADWLVERKRKKLRAAELRLGLAPLPDLQRRLSDALSFEQQLTAYEALKARFDELSFEVAAKRGAADEWRKVKDAMTILRGLVKQHLIPSLNRVASHLITGMTGGQRQSIVVNEDFDVTVDGQALDTLSGSGKAVANLALRLGLGQVLTNKVFSVFIGDEIDASLDQDRAENCAATLQAVKRWLSQVVLISHKSMPADYCIDLGAAQNTSLAA
jgi:DNA repair protein SbcC/Rad50